MMEEVTLTQTDSEAFENYKKQTSAIIEELNQEIKGFKKKCATHDSCLQDSETEIQSLLNELELSKNQLETRLASLQTINET